LNPSLASRLHLFDRLSQLVQSGIPVLRALHFLEEKTASGRLSLAAGEIRREVERGKTLAGALLTRPGLLDPPQTRILEVSERGGRLEEGLKTIAADLGLELELGQRLRRSLYYPCFLVHAAILIPNLRLWVLDSAGAYLRAVLPSLLSIYLVVGGSWLAWRWARSRLSIARVLWQVGAAAPLLGRPLRHLATARFLQALSGLQEAAVPVEEMVGLSALASGNPLWRMAVPAALRVLKKGGRLHEALALFSGLPGEVLEQVATAEEAGRFHDVLPRLAIEARERSVASLQFAVTVMGRGIYLLGLGMIAAQILAGAGALAPSYSIPE
jgi:type II secretory pathway component PulF